MAENGYSSYNFLKYMAVSKNILIFVYFFFFFFRKIPGMLMIAVDFEKFTKNIFRILFIASASISLEFEILIIINCEIALFSFNNTFF